MICYGETKYELIEKNVDYERFFQRMNKQERWCECTGEEKCCDKPWANCKNIKYNIICDRDNCRFGDTDCGNRIGKTYIISCYPRKV